MAALSTQNIIRTGLAITFSSAAGGGDTMTAGVNSFLLVKNGGGGAITVTITAPSNQNPIANVTYSNLVVSVAAGATTAIGALPPSYYGDASTNNVAISYSGVTSVTVAAINLNIP